MSDVISPSAVDAIIPSDDDFTSDSLSSSFMSSFSLPPPTPKKQTPATAEATLIIPASENVDANAPSVSSSSAPTASDPSAVSHPEPAVDHTVELEKNLKLWREESSVAREKSESTRLRLEEEAAKEQARIKQAAKDEKAKLSKAQEDAEVERKLAAELAKDKARKGKGNSKRAAKKEKEQEENSRWANVKDAWEIVKEGGQADGGEIEVDGRDLVEGDAGGKEGNQGREMLEQIHAATQAVHPQPSTSSLIDAPSSSRRSDLLSPSSDPSTSLPPAERQQTIATAWADSSKPVKPVASPATAEEAAVSYDAAKRDQASGQKGGEEGGEEVMGVPHAESAVGRGMTEPVPTGIDATGLSTNELPSSGSKKPSPKSSSTPPEQPPSLTLSLFTLPSHRSILRISAVLGINLVLPFINGVMLGFGEIFARESVKWGKLWWRGEVKFRSWTGGPGSTVAGAGLGYQEGARRGDAVSGSGGFP